MDAPQARNETHGRPDVRTLGTDAAAPFAAAQAYPRPHEIGQVGQGGVQEPSLSARPGRPPGAAKSVNNGPGAVDNPPGPAQVEYTGALPT